MTVFLGLMKREWLESRTAFFWLPVGLLGFVFVSSLLGFAISGSVESHILLSGDNANFIFIDGWTDTEVEQRMAMFRLAASGPFWLIYIVAAFFVLLGSLYDERKDRSVLFFKSLPVTDAETVASKLLLVIWAAPLVTVAVIVVTQLFLLTMVTIFIAAQDLGDPSRLWWHSGLIMGAVQLVFGYFIQGFWTLPIFAWLMLVSTTAPKLPLLWAALVPFAASLGERISFGTNVISQSITRHIQPVALSVQEGDSLRVPLSFSDQLALFATAELWVGLLVGAALLYGTVRFRGIYNEL
jgi:ABC-2 type transport system permease protein